MISILLYVWLPSYSSNVKENLNEFPSFPNNNRSDFVWRESSKIMFSFGCDDRVKTAQILVNQNIRFHIRLLKIKIFAQLWKMLENIFFSFYFIIFLLSLLSRFSDIQICPSLWMLGADYMDWMGFSAHVEIFFKLA